jgi:hypothetical protein
MVKIVWEAESERLKQKPYKVVYQINLWVNFGTVLATNDI